MPRRPSSTSKGNNHLLRRRHTAHRTPHCSRARQEQASVVAKESVGGRFVSSDESMNERICEPVPSDRSMENWLPAQNLMRRRESFTRSLRRRMQRVIAATVLRGARPSLGSTTTTTAQRFASRKPPLSPEQARAKNLWTKVGMAAGVFGVALGAYLGHSRKVRHPADRDTRSMDEWLTNGWARCGYFLPLCVVVVQSKSGLEAAERETAPKPPQQSPHLVAVFSKASLQSPAATTAPPQPVVRSAC